MTTGTSILPELRIAVANFRPGGIDAGSTGRWDQMMRWDKAVSALRAWQPHLVLGQEISAAAPGGLRARRGCLTAPQTLPEGDLIGARLSHDRIGRPARPGRALLNTGDGTVITVAVPAG